MSVIISKGPFRLVFVSGLAFSCVLPKPVVAFCNRVIFSRFWFRCTSALVAEKHCCAVGFVSLFLLLVPASWMFWSVAAFSALFCLRGGFLAVTKDGGRLLFSAAFPFLVSEFSRFDC